MNIEDRITKWRKQHLKECEKQIPGNVDALGAIAGCLEGTHPSQIAPGFQEQWYSSISRSDPDPPSFVRLTCLGCGESIEMSDNEEMEKLDQ